MRRAPQAKDKPSRSVSHGTLLFLLDEQLTADAAMVSGHGAAYAQDKLLPRVTRPIGKRNGRPRHFHEMGEAWAIGLKLPRKVIWMRQCEAMSLWAWRRREIEGSDSGLSSHELGQSSLVEATDLRLWRRRTSARKTPPNSSPTGDWVGALRPHPPEPDAGSDPPTPLRP